MSGKALVLDANILIRAVLGKLGRLTSGERLCPFC